MFDSKIHFVFSNSYILTLDSITPSFFSCLKTELMSIPTYIVITDLYFIRITQCHHLRLVISLVQKEKVVVKTKANTAMSVVEKLHFSISHNKT